MTSRQKAKGYRYEKKTEEFLNNIPGWTAHRQLASGAYGKYDETLDGDVLFTQLYGWDGGEVATYKVEVKARDKDFPKWIEKALTQGDIVALWKCGNKKSKGFILLPIETFKEIII
jgi:hypothetical protein